MFLFYYLVWVQSITERQEVTNDRHKTKQKNTVYVQIQTHFLAQVAFSDIIQHKLQAKWCCPVAGSGGRMHDFIACHCFMFPRTQCSSVEVNSNKTSCVSWKHPVSLYDRFILFSSVVFMSNVSRRAALIKSGQEEELGYEYLHFLVVSPSPPHTSPALHFHVV